MGGVALRDSMMGQDKVTEQTRANTLVSSLLAKYKNLRESGRLASTVLRLEVAVALCKMGTKPSLSNQRSLEREVRGNNKKNLLSMCLRKPSANKRFGLIKKSGANNKFVRIILEKYYYLLVETRKLK